MNHHSPDPDLNLPSSFDQKVKLFRESARLKNARAEETREAPSVAVPRSECDPEGIPWSFRS